MFKDYKELLNKIDSFLVDLRNRYPQSIKCKMKCSECCVAGINLWRVEFDRISTCINDEGIEIYSSSCKSDRCVMLDENGLCSIYHARPVVCRLWGAPLLLSSSDSTDNIERTPHISAPCKIGSSEKTLICCSKNFSEEIKSGTLPANDMLNGDLVLTTLAAINHVYCEKNDLDPTERISIAKTLQN
jgi:hypothetical protein